MAVVRHDQVLDLRAQHVGKVRDRRDRRANHHRAERDVADEIAFARVARRAVVFELLELADVVQQRAGGQQILVGAVGGAERERRSRDRQDVLEEPAAIGVVHRLARPARCAASPRAAS